MASGLRLGGRVRSMLTVMLGGDLGVWISVRVLGLWSTVRVRGAVRVMGLWVGVGLRSGV